MKKIVTTEMTDKSIIVTMASGSASAIYEFSFELCNPKTVLNIATLLVSDPTIPQENEEEKK